MAQVCPFGALAAIPSPAWVPPSVRVSTFSEEFVKTYHLSARASTQDGKVAPQGAKGQHKAWPDAAVTVGKAFLCQAHVNSYKTVLRGTRNTDVLSIATTRW